ncbi:unannotated protein [freshwater metagenome]|uniref:Unannotated protein n=1 Tax=freshwater metagenome TaxID=449393 RepID=A0A6J6Y6W0_9ZZZZ
MCKQSDLILYPRDHFWVRVAHRRHGDTRTQINQVVAININQDSARGAFNKDRQGGTDSAGNSIGSALHERIGLGPWDGGNDPSFLRDIEFLGQRRKAHAL